MTDPFAHRVPASAAPYCHSLWQQYGFDLRVVQPRRTRFGDFRVLPGGRTQITVNVNLNPYAFLITYVHEVAHAEVYAQTSQQARRSRLPPHGEVWRTTFRRLMQPLLTDAVFPASILKPLVTYLNRPAATTAGNPALMLALRQVDSPAEPQLGRVLLRDLPEGQSFQLAKKTYVRGTLRRTRIVCKETSSGRSYAILSHAWVETI